MAIFPSLSKEKQAVGHFPMRGGGAYGEAENPSLCAVPHRDRYDHAVHSATCLLSF